MASSFFALLDDISALMDDVASVSKIATEKTAGILGDDLAVNAEKSSGFLQNRELPVLWKITKGSFLNKLMILPVAFLLSAFVPLVITIILICGGVYLAYEGVEKIVEYLFHTKPTKTAEEIVKLSPEESLKQEEKKVKSAIFIDFILSIEIIIIALSTVTSSDLLVQIMVVTYIAIVATIGVYGIVALIVRMDDVGFRLIKANRNTVTKTLGIGLVKALPLIIKLLGVVGTVALIFVSGGIFTHNVHQIHDALSSLPSLVADALVGLLIGSIAVLATVLYKKIIKSPATAS